MASARPPPDMAAEFTVFAPFVLLFLLLFLVFGVLLPYWVYRDAEAKGSDNAVLWALVVFFAPLLGLVLYLILGDEY